MTAAVKGIGSTLTWGANPVAEVLTISGPNISAEEIEVTNFDSPNGFKEYISGLKDGGTVDFELNWTLTPGGGQEELRNDLGTGTKRPVVLTFATSPETRADFTGLVTAMSWSADPASQVTASVTVRIDGEISWS
jgi:hypothetical protein